MDLVICIIFLYLTHIISSNDVNLPNHLSELLNKLIKETENKSENKTSFEIIEPGTTSKIIYVKEKANPKVIWQVKYEDITDKRIEDVMKKTNMFQDFINHKNINRNVYGNFMNPKDIDKKSIQSFEYILEHIPEHTTLKDPSPANEEITTEYGKKVGRYKHPDVFDEIALDKNNIKDSENILNNLTELISKTETVQYFLQISKIATLHCVAQPMRNGYGYVLTPGLHARTQLKVYKRRSHRTSESVSDCM
ncbi:uncharacterized protein LOC125067517 [Vanessa atalanta]|uniref:uncharacterized protein LOC125067517 n=1 Tax=Vanessa atalanta TaxID=42275 RepID=UPI001FCDF429|nr:uncharacterized protein LOC125067517 [Vanessa atalanta]